MFQREKENNELSILQKLDIFGIGISIKFNERDKHYTKIGGCFSMIVIILMLGFSLNLLSQIVYRQNPQVVFEQNSVMQPKRYDLNPINFSLAVTLLNDDNQPFIDESLYSITGQVFRKNKIWDSDHKSFTEDTGNTVFELVPCTQDMFQEPQSRSYFLGLDYKNMYCIKDQSKLFIEGQFDADRFNMVRMSVNECIDNQKENVTCQDKQIRKTKLQNTKLQIYYVNRIIHIRNYDEPFQKVG